MTSNVRRRPAREATRLRPGDRGSAQVIWTLLSGGVALLLFVVIVIVVLVGGQLEACGKPASSTAQQDIPANYLDLYQRAGKQYQIDWSVLAGIGKVETDHGRSTLPGVHSGQNYAGAGGPMQFLQPTWDAYGVDGNGDGRKDRYDPADAIPGAANYLKASGAPQKMRDALFAYNHSWDYVDLVLSWAKKYADGDFSVGDANLSGASCPDGDGFGQGNWPPGAVCPAGTVLGPDSITARMRCVRDQIKTMFKFDGVIGCYRSNGGIAGGGEHPRGRACDFMINPNSPAGVQLGYNVANWAQANADRLGIYYIIYRQRIWNPSRARDGWRRMEDRGSITQNHYDHVHISVLP